MTAWKSKGLPEEIMEPSAASKNTLGSGLNYIEKAKKKPLKLGGGCFVTL